MKKIIFIILTALITCPIFSQSYFPDSSAIWNVSTNNLGTGELHYGLKGDSLINDTLYNKVYLITDTTFNSMYLKEFVGGVRQNAGKVWFRPDTANGFTEFLLYDFTKNIGDTIWHNANLAPTSFNGSCFPNISYYSGYCISIIKDKYTENGYEKFTVETHATYNESAYPIVQHDWIVGIGSSLGLFWQHYIPIITTGGGCSNPLTFQLACFKQNDTVKYINNPSCSTCYCDITEGFKEQNTDGVIVFPSPVKNNLKLELPGFVNLKNVQVSIYDINGKQKRLLSTTEHEITVDVSQLIAGIYLLKISSNNYNEVVKFVKE